MAGRWWYSIRAHATKVNERGPFSFNWQPETRTPDALNDTRFRTGTPAPKAKRRANLQLLDVTDTSFPLAKLHLLTHHVTFSFTLLHGTAAF